MNNNNGQKLAGKVAVVTGGSRGIGAAITKRLAADGASVAFTYAKGADAAASVVKEIERSGGKAIAIQADAADASAKHASSNAVGSYQADEGVGRFRYADMNGQGWIDNNSKTFLGNPSPKFTYGANLGLAYKHFDFSMFVYGVYGNDVWNNVKWWTDFYASFPGAASSRTALYDSWTFTNHNAKAPIQDAVNGSNGSTNTTTTSNTLAASDDTNPFPALDAGRV